ncbi:MAG TPA: DMT family transporter [Rhodocyclaceae bacterium]|nr:DMT family transporter [Rhodocyclaceae bacterium]
MTERNFPRWLPFVVLGIGLSAISFGAILARIAQAEQIPSLAIAAWRLGFAALVVTPFALLMLWRNVSLQSSPRDSLRSQKNPANATLVAGSSESFTLSRRQVGLGLAAGFCLALHFGTWISSLEYTSVASSTALVTTNPLWIGLASFVLFGERPGRAMLAGIGLSLAGSFLIFLSDSQSAAAGSNSLLGNTLALVGSWCFSAYLMIGRRLRAGLTLTLYIWLAYGIAALFLFGAAGGSGAALAGFGLGGWLALAGMALGPQLIGHTSYNWSLKHVSATFVAVVTLGEPIGSALMAFLFFGETLAPVQALGFGLLLAGIYLAAKGERA